MTISSFPHYELDMFGRYLANVSFLKKGKLAMSALISSPDAQVVKQQLLSCVGAQTRLGSYCLSRYSRNSQSLFL